MLKISQVYESGECITLLLEGRICGAWVDELQRECQACLQQRHTVTLDLSGVSFVDRAGIDLLRQMISCQQLHFVGCSIFVAGLLAQESS